MTRTSRALGILCAATILSVTSGSEAAAGTWGFRGTTYPNGDVNCSGEPNSPHLASECDMTSSGGARVTTTQWGDFCVAAVWCGQTVHSCFASETSSTIVHCWATGFANGNSYAQCKSDNGNWAVSCPYTLHVPDEDEMAAVTETSPESETGNPAPDLGEGESGKAD